ncbi:MAG: 50S ribosomal protein L4 [Proteobacteria bacterium]|nr:50S ribosomal protein L4 [Pseudomonadota bacterium]
MKVAVKTLENKDAGQLDLDDAIFGVEVKNDVLHRVVHWQLNKRRAGTHKTKDVSEVAGTGKKPHAQKGTGQARAGQKRRPQTVGGGRVFGPTPRSHATNLPKKLRALGLKMALSAKAKDKKLIIIDEAKPKTHKTKPMAAALKKMGCESALIVGGKEVDANFARATSNLQGFDVLPSTGANVYDILRRDMLVLTKDAVTELTERLKG